MLIFKYHFSPWFPQIIFKHLYKYSKQDIYANKHIHICTYIHTHTRICKSAKHIKNLCPQTLLGLVTRSIQRDLSMEQPALFPCLLELWIFKTHQLLHYCTAHSPSLQLRTHLHLFSCPSPRDASFLWSTKPWNQISGHYT